MKTIVFILTSSSLKIESIGCSETSIIIYQIMCRHIHEEDNFHIHFCQPEEIEAIGCSGTSIHIYQTTRLHIPEDRDLNIH
jgi:hypothetical protein